MQRKTLTLAAMTLAVSACGGNASFSGIGSTPPNNIGSGSGSGDTITAASSYDVAKASYLSATNTGNISGLVGVSGVAGGSGNVTKPEPGALAIAAVKRVGGVVQAVPFGPDTVDCGVSGTVTSSGDIADPVTPTLTPGDTISIIFNSCDDGVGEVLDGAIDYTVDAFSGDLQSGLYQLVMTLQTTAFQVTTAAGQETLNGDATVDLDTRQSPAVTASVTGSSLTTDRVVTTETLTDYSTTQTANAGQTPSPYSILASGVLEHTDIDGPVAYSTPTMFEGFDTNYPSTGLLLITAPEGTFLRLIALDDVNVRLEMDSTGDGSVDSIEDLSWDSLLLGP